MDRPGKGERGFVKIRDGRTGVAANVEAFVGRIEATDLLVEATFANLVLSEPQDHGATGLEFSLLVDLHLDGERLATCGDRIGGRDAVADLVVVVVLPVQPAVLHEDGEATPEAAAADEHAFGPSLRYFHLGSNRMVKILGVGR